LFTVGTQLLYYCRDVRKSQTFLVFENRIYATVRAQRRWENGRENAIRVAAFRFFPKSDVRFRRLNRKSFDRCVRLSVKPSRRNGNENLKFENKPVVDMFVVTFRRVIFFFFFTRSNTSRRAKVAKVLQSAQHSLCDISHSRPQLYTIVELGVVWLRDKNVIETSSRR